MVDNTEQAPKDLIGMLDFYLVKKAPFQLPDGAKEVIVKFGPWLILILILISIPALLLLFGLGAVAGTAALATGQGVAAGSMVLSGIVLVATIALEAIALPGLFARKMSGWTMLFYARLVAFAGGLLTLSPFTFIIGLIWGGIWLVVSLYILFQVRSLYK